MSALPSWNLHAGELHWIFRHFNRWQNFLGSVVGLFGVAWSLWKNHSNSLAAERRKRAQDRNGIRIAFSAEINNIVGQCTRWIDHIIPDAKKTGQKSIYPPARFRTPIYDTLKASIIHLSDLEIAKLISFHGQINHMTREFLRIELDDKDKDMKRAYRMNVSSVLEEDTFCIDINNTGFFEKRLRDLKKNGEEARALMIQNPKTVTTTNG